jgi:hypothetical protein
VYFNCKYVCWHARLLWTAVTDPLAHSCTTTQSPTPKNDFCRLFVKCDVLKHLANALLCTTKNPSAHEYADRTADIFLLFAHGDTVVKKHMADPSSGGVLECMWN